MSRTVCLHIGIAKTGTTYLQRRLFANRDLLRRNGTLYPGTGPAAHFLGSLDLRGATFKGHVYDEVDGAWDRLVAAADAFPGTTLISHETLARAKPAQISRAVAAFGTGDVRVLVTARDLARQIPATWQETLKNRSETRYSDYLDEVFAGWSAGKRPGGGFWAVQDVAGLVRRWAAVVGADRVVVVTVPPSGSDRDELWQRFANAAGLPDVAYADPQHPGNASLGAAEAELLRRLNPLLTDQLDWPAYETRVKRRLAEQILGPIAAAGRLVTPAERAAEVQAIAVSQVESLEASGAKVVGSWSDLLPTETDPVGGPHRHPDDLTDGELLGAALRGLAALASAPPVAATSPPLRRRLGRVRRRVTSTLRRFTDRIPRRQP